MRRRIVGLAVLAATLAVVLFGAPLALGVAQLAVTEEQAALQRLAVVTARSVQTELAHNDDPDSLPDSGDDTQLALYDADGDLLLGNGPPDGGDPIRAALDGKPEQTNEGGLLVVTVPVAGEHEILGAVRATRPVASVYRHLVPAWLGMAGLAVFVVVAVWGLAHRQSRRLARPLETLAMNAQRLGDGDFGTRAPPAGLPEIDAVGRALNDTAERLDALLARERAFSAEASHQLRTPLAGLRLRLESALGMPDRDARRAVRAGIASADQLERTIDELLLLAREPASTRGGPVDLGALVAELAAPRTDRLSVSGRRLEVKVEENLPQSSVSAAAVRQVLGVLLDNAEVHGAGTIRVMVRDSAGAVAVDVGDEGKGIGTDAMATPRPGGMGLGLARRLAEAERGRLVLTRPAPPIFTLFVPATQQVVDDWPVLAVTAAPEDEPLNTIRS